MGEHWRVTKNNSDDLGFAMWCLTSWAVDMDEFRAWCTGSSSADEVPEHLLSLGDAKDRFDVTLDRGDLVGWVPSWEPTPLEDQAIDGIAYAGLPDHESDLVDRVTALAALRSSPQLLRRFRHDFPTVEVPGFLDMSTSTLSACGVQGNEAPFYRCRPHQ